MRPRTDEILASMLWTFETYIAPEVESSYGRSLTLTMANLFRHVLLRVRLEGQLLFEDREDLCEVLRQCTDYLRTRQSPEMEAAARRVDAVIADVESEHDYPAPDVLVDQLVRLRGVLTETLVQLQQARNELAPEPGYQASRQAIRGYLGRSLDRDGQMIEPAFTGDRR